MDVNSLVNNTQTDNSSQSSNSGTELNTDSFMQLFLAELENQDPTQSMSTSDMLTQFAQISTIEALTQLTESQESTQSAMQSMFAHQLLGTDVTVQDDNGNNVSGTVSSISFSDGSPYLVINNQSYPMSNLVSMS